MALVRNGETIFGMDVLPALIRAISGRGQEVLGVREYMEDKKNSTRAERFWSMFSASLERQSLAAENEVCSPVELYDRLFRYTTRKFDYLHLLIHKLPAC